MNYKDEDPDNLGGLGDMLPAEVLKKVNELLEQMQRIGHTNNGNKIELVYVAPGAQIIQHLDSQIINQGVQGESFIDRHTNEEDSSKNHQFCIPSPEVMAKAVEKTIDDGLWAKGTCWSVVYVVYRILGYEGSVSDFVREVESWKFAKPMIYKCNRDSVGKPLRDKRMTYNLDKWLSNGVQKQFYILAIALLGEIKSSFRQ